MTSEAVEMVPCGHLKCGHTWDEPGGKPTACPGCGESLHVELTLRSTLSDIASRVTTPFSIQTYFFMDDEGNPRGVFRVLDGNGIPVSLAEEHPDQWHEIRP